MSMFRSFRAEGISQGVLLTAILDDVVVVVLSARFPKTVLHVGYQAWFDTRRLLVL
jgi:hypothetical protein